MFKKPRKWIVSPGLVNPEWRWAWHGLQFAAPLWEGAAEPYDSVLGTPANANTAMGAWGTNNAGAIAIFDNTELVEWDPRGRSITGGYTIGVVVQMDGDSSWNSFGGLFAKNSDLSSNVSTSIQRNGGSDVLIVFHNNSVGTTLTTAISDLTTTPHVLVVTYDAVSNTLIDYLDGVQKGSRGFTSSVDPTAGAGPYKINTERTGTAEGSGKYIAVCHWDFVFSARQALLWSRAPLDMFRMVDEVGVVIVPAVVGGRVMSSLAGAGGLAGMGGIAGQGGGLAG